MKDFQTDGVLRPIVNTAAAGHMPEWAVNAPMPSQAEFSKLANAAFADPGNRLLPVHNRECTLWSAAYVAAHPAWYPEGSTERVKAAAAALGVDAEFDTIQTFWNSQIEDVKQASAPVEKAAFALTLDDGEPFGMPAGRVDLLPCHDEWHIERSAEELDKAASAGTFPPELVISAAAGLCKAAASVQCADVLPRLVSRIGQDRFPDWSKAARLLGDRRQKVGDGYRAYEELIKLGSDQPELSELVISGLRDLDTQFNLRYWGAKLASVVSPWEAVYSGPLISEIEKMADTHVVLAGALVPVEVLASIETEEIDRNFGKSAAEHIKEAKAAADNAYATAALSNLTEDVQVRLFDLLVAK